MPSYFVSGTDTDVGKTRVTAALALALSQRAPVTIVKPIQTGLEKGEVGDAERAGALAGVASRELRRFRKPADPWSAALAQGVPPPDACSVAADIRALPGALVVEGAGGLMVPLNAREHFGHVALLANLPMVLAVGMRLGCMNHALLTLAACAQLGVSVAGAVLVERWEPVGAEYIEDVTRALQEHVKILGIVAFAADEQASVRAASRLFADLAM